MSKAQITFYNRETKQNEIEKIYGDAFIRWLYCTPSGKGLSGLLTKAPISKAYGWMQDSSLLSGHKAKKFIQDFNIKMDEFEPGSLSASDIQDSYKSFNEFFIRKFKPGKRVIAENPELMPAFCEARYLGYESISLDQVFPVKGEELTAKKLLANEEWSHIFDGGPLMIARLCPVDYHRFHFPDDGEVLVDYRVHGAFHSVNPFALRFKDEVFSENERHVTILETKNFGKIAYIEVGAICVGKIIQNYEGKTFKRGQEKGYFLFGASTVIVLGEKNKFKIASDIVDNSKNRLETYLKLGSVVASRL